MGLCRWPMDELDPRTLKFGFPQEPWKGWNGYAQIRPFRSTTTVPRYLGTVIKYIYM